MSRFGNWLEQMRFKPELGETIKVHEGDDPMASDFKIKIYTGDPRFNPTDPVEINGYPFVPVVPVDEVRPWEGMEVNAVAMIHLNGFRTDDVPPELLGLAIAMSQATSLRRIADLMEARRAD